MGPLSLGHAKVQPTSEGLELLSLGFIVYSSPVAGLLMPGKQAAMRMLLCSM
jgi:hypothetical protein